MSLFKNAGSDIPAGVVVFFVALPLCLGIAMASGAPLFSGLIAGIVGGIVVGFISGSPLGVSGPAAGLTVLVLSGIAELNSFEMFLVAVIMAGMLQIILGILKAGIIAYYFPSAVIKGMLSGIGVIIVLKQIPHLFGYDSDYEGDENFVQMDGENTFTELIHMINFIAPNSFIVGCLALAILLAWELYLSKKGGIFKLIQGPTVAVVLSIVYELVTTAFFPDFQVRREHLVTVPNWKTMDSIGGLFAFPDWTVLSNPKIYLMAGTIAVVASLETLLCVEATDKLDPERRVTSTNRELIAQGVGNITCGLIGGLPVTQVIVRSSANVQSGGKTKFSAIFHGFLILICIIWIPNILNLIPLSALAAILIMVGYKLAKPELFKKLYALGWTQFVPFLATIVGIVLLDLLKGITIGMIIAFFIILRNSFKNSHFLHTKTDDGENHKVRMTLAEEVTFLNKGAILSTLNKLPKGTDLTIDLSQSVMVDYDVLEVIEDYKVQFKERGIKLTIVE